MRKPWEESGSHRDFGDRAPRRSDRRDDRAPFERRSDRRDDGLGRREGGFGRREDGFGRREGGFVRRDDRGDRSERRGGFGGSRFGGDRFEGRRGDRDGNLSFGGRRDGGFRRRDDRQENVFGVRSGPRARAASMNRRDSARAFDATNATRNALVTLDADVARVFGSSEAVNAALRQLIALAQLIGPQAMAQAAKEDVSEATAEETAEEENVEGVEAVEAEVSEVVADEAQTEEADDEDEEWFEIPTEAK